MNLVSQCRPIARYIVFASYDVIVGVELCRKSGNVCNVKFEALLYFKPRLL
jgi:hypothetical protein